MFAFLFRSQGAQLVRPFEIFQSWTVGDVDALVKRYYEQDLSFGLDAGFLGVSFCATHPARCLLPPRQRHVVTMAGGAACGCAGARRTC